MLSAQDSPVGVPRELLEAKKAELQQEQVSALWAYVASTINQLYSFPKPPPMQDVPKNRRKML